MRKSLFFAGYFMLCVVTPMYPVIADESDDLFQPIMEIDLSQDSKAAVTENKWLMIMFTKDGCSACARMKAETLSDQQVKAFFRRHIIAYDVNIFGDLPIIDAAGKVWTEKTYAKKEGIWGTPAFYFFDEAGERIHKHVGFLGKHEFIAMGKYVAERSASLDHDFSKHAQNR